jgi:putative NIF3 family GTP cyclohydrolase 1 type 2
MRPMSRREFAALTAGAAVASPLAFTRTPGATVTAQAVVERIQKSAGVDWKPETVDTFKAGDPATLVTGIVTTSLATIDVLSQAVAAGANLVVTSGPTFYARADNPTPPSGRGRAGASGPPGATAPAAPAPPPDRVFAAKHEFIKKHDLVVWRFSDHWRLRQPDPLALGLTDAFGWSKFRAADDPSRVTIPAITLEALASDLKKKLNARGGVRVVGDPQLRVQRIGLLPGSTPIQAALNMMPAVDVIVAGEVREWESVEYARDKLTAGEKKGLILVGRVVSEDPAMNVCAQWLKTIVPEVKSTWVPVGDPYWRPV